MGNILVLCLGFLPVSNAHRVQERAKIQQSGNPLADIHLNQSQINQLLSDYQTEKFHYLLYVTDDTVNLEVTYKWLGLQIPVTIEFTPEITETGAVNLKAKELKSGRLNLPIKQVLYVLDKIYQVPTFVTIDSGGKVILVDLPKIDFSDNYLIKAREFDLKKGEFTFFVYQKQS